MRTLHRPEVTDGSDWRPAGQTLREKPKFASARWIDRALFLRIWRLYLILDFKQSFDLFAVTFGVIR